MSKRIVELKQALDKAAGVDELLKNDIMDLIFAKINEKGTVVSKFEIRLDSDKYKYNSDTLVVKAYQALAKIKQELINLDPERSECWATTINYGRVSEYTANVIFQIEYGRQQLKCYDD